MVAEITLHGEDAAPAKINQPHVIHLAFRWHEVLRADPNLTMAELARRQGLSRARVTQILNLLRLPSPVIRELRRIRTAEETRRFPEHALRRIRLLKSADEQFAAFCRLRHSIDRID